MGFRDTSTSWGWPTKLLHWGMAVLIIGLLALGTYMTKLEVGLERFELTQIHKSFGPFNDPDSYIYIPNMVFGLFEMPDPIAKGDAVLTKQLKVIHQYIGYALAALLVLHVAAAIKHHFILRDYVLVRMLPFGQDR